MSRRYIIAGGGTGGHIFPALAIAQAIGRTEPQAEILFVGAKGKMEMEKVPEAGYRIEGLDIAGFNRSSLIKNVGLPLKLVKSVWQVRQILQRFRPHAVLGVGGYSTFPVLLVAQWKGIPTFIHEANSYAGKANRLLGKKATKVFTATDGMEAFFPPGRICITGNPVREAITGTPLPQEAARSFFGLQPHRSTLLVVGGSLGARSINAAVDAGLDRLLESGLQVIWQTGKLYAGQARQRCAGKSGVWVSDFIGQMDQA
ncbi:MAG TPA: UDP-N-acetylglucosamine--N-acetylmuramyl-(pentapeptide) pyrophosphoryl-undecaprenol N-acetylglucosamine transferase, partial [Lacibacter sp.]|nr:UDP-N-acetylglucosamine--N-acetylmuramyl-(pentapeptide) pyrophosphoryl-undecaprenol N-acetylglucosamine transferase [Lacibacter sp.]